MARMKSIQHRLWMSPLFQRASNMAVGSMTNMFMDRPWRSKTVRFALLVVVLGMAFWVKGLFGANHPAPNSATGDASSASHGFLGLNFGEPIPWYVRVCVSYIGGFLLGWTFRRFIRILMIITVLIIGALGLGRFAGCDTTSLKTKVGHEADVAKEKAKQERDYLKHLLPSAFAAGFGVFYGFWRRSRGLEAPDPRIPPTATPPPGQPV